MKVSRILSAWILAAALSVPAMAQQETDADFSRYCATKYPNSTHQRIGLAHYCRQPGRTGGATQHNINLAEACRITTGNDSYRRAGSRVLCQPGTETAVNSSDAGERTLSATDFQAYCRTEFPNSTYEKRAESWGTVHYCRRPGATGGFTLQNVDLAKACQLAHAVSDYREETGRVVCSGSGESQTANREVPAPSPGPKPGPLPPVPPPGPEALPQPAPVPPDVLPNQPTVQTENEQFDPQMLASACQSLGGQWRSGTIPMVEQIRRQTDDQITKAVAEFSTLPWQKSWIEQHQKGTRVQFTVSAYFQILMIWQCHAALVRYPERNKAEDIRAARDEACEIQRHLDRIQAAINDNGGNMTVALYQKTLDAWELDNVCEGPDLKLFRVDSDGVVVVEDRIRFYGGPFYLEVRYENESKSPQKQVKLEMTSKIASATGGNVKEILVYRLDSDPSVFRSEEFYIIPELPSLERVSE